MSCRSYTLRNGEPTEVIVTPDTSIDDVARELRRLYGSAYHLGRWGRRGNRWRAAVVRKDEQFRNYPRSAGDLGWFEVAP